MCAVCYNFSKRKCCYSVLELCVVVYVCVGVLMCVFLCQGCLCCVFFSVSSCQGQISSVL